MHSGQKEALSNINEISEGQLPEYLKEVLEINLPKSGKKSKITLGVAEKNLAGAIKNAFPGLNALTADTSDVCAELLRGIRVHASKLIEGLNDGDLEQAGRGLGHAYSRGRIMFDPKRNDQSIMQALATVEIDDKGTNNSYMRLRETYGWHFPELSKIESDNYTSPSWSRPSVARRTSQTTSSTTSPPLLVRTARRPRPSLRPPRSPWVASSVRRITR